MKSNGWIAACVLSVAAGIGVLAAGAGSEDWVNDLSPITAAEWDYDKAAHLIERDGFGATPDEIERLAAMSPKAVSYTHLRAHETRHELV